MKRDTIAKTDDCALCTADAVTVKGYSGIAFNCYGHPVETQHYEDAETGEWEEGMDLLRTDQVLCVMVGDDRRFTFDIEDAKPLARERFCGECGQVGCPHDGLDREDPVSA